MTGSSCSDIGEKFTEPVFEVRKQSPHTTRCGSFRKDIDSEVEASPDTEEQDEDGEEEQQNDLRRVASEKPSVNNIKSVPNGGLTAWLQVLGSFFLFFNSWGIINAFGTYQTYYETGILSSSSPSDISWIGSVEGCLLLLVGTFTGPIYDRGYMRQLVAFGSVLIVFCQMMLSLCTEYWQVFLAQGIGMGIGAGCLFVPSVAILSTYFSTHLATATGIAAAGSGIGGMIYPISFRQLQPTLGFPWAARINGFIMLGTLLVSNCVYRVRVTPGPARKLWDFTAFKELPYLFLTLGICVGFAGLYAPFFYVQSFAIAEGITNEDMGFYLLSILNASSIFGRILPNLLADKTGPLNMIVPTSFMAGVIGLCFIPARSLAAIIVLVVLYGFFSGTFVSLPPTAMVRITKNRSLIGTWMGQSFGVISIGILLGTPISGWILASSNFTCVWIWGGVMTMFGAVLIGASRVAFVGWTIKKAA